MTTRVRSYVMFCRYMFGEEGYCLTSIHTAVNYLVSEGLNKCGTWNTQCIFSLYLSRNTTQWRFFSVFAKKHNSV